MAITSELIGKLGGADVETRVVSMKGSGGSSRKPKKWLLTEVEVPPGQTLLVTVLGSWLELPNTVNPPHFTVGTTKSPAFNTSQDKDTSGGGLLNESGSVILNTTDSINAVEFVGVVYIVKL